MKKRKKILTGLLALTILSSLVIMSGCGTEEDKPKAKTSSADNEVNSIKETKLEGYEVNVKSSYVHMTSAFGVALKFEVKFDNITPSYEAYVYNDMSSLIDKDVEEENSKRYEELKENNPDISEEQLNGDDYSLWYKTIYFENVSYDAGKSVEIEWAPYPTEENSSKFSSQEEYLKTGYMYLILKEEENITGFMVFEFPVGTKDESNSVTYEEINVLEAVAFEKVDGEYQNISLDYVKSRIDKVLENKN